MQKRLLTGAERYTKQNHRRRVWRKFVQVMACIVVFCTTYALILPAITMEKSWCGLEEHTHSESCYRKVESETAASLACTYESLGVHIHTAQCYDSENRLLCGLADYLVHTHDASCVDASGIQVCQIPERVGHVHTDECYIITESATEPAHYHEESCYTAARGALICQKEETEGHTHGESCYTQGQLLCLLEEQEAHIHGEQCSETVLVCSLEVEPHVHGDECYTQLVCDIPEGEDHTHTEECSGTILVCDLTEQPHIHTDACYETHFICGLPETEGHTHEAECYEALLVCQVSEEEPHFHTDSCYEQISALVCTLEEGVSPETSEATRELICTEPEAQIHVHSDSCYVAAAEEDPLTCTLTEDENHTHDATCYGTWELICGKAEHSHDLRCMSNPEADVETEAEWTASFADAQLTDVWAADLVAIARTQLGYTESTRNYAVMPDNETIKGYTRYGAWYGEPYGDWCAMFVSFCLNYAGVDAMPLNSNCPEWIQTLTEASLYHPSGEYTPRSGDVIFFDWNGDHISDHVGIVTEMIAATEEEPAKIKTIEGNIGDRVGSHDYAPDDATILGYAALPENPRAICGLQEHSHDDTCLDEDGELICGMEEHTHDLSCNVLREEEKFRVDAVIAAIDAMPSAEEIDARVAEYQEQGDEDGEIAYLEQVFAQVQQVYRTYAALGETLQRYVTNADKLMELEYIWAAATLDTISTATIYQINSYANNAEATLFMGNSPSAYTTFAFSWWLEAMVELDSDGYLRVVSIIPHSNGTDKSNHMPGANGFMLLFHNEGTGGIPSISVGDYVTVNTVLPASGAYTGTGYATVTFSSTPPFSLITSDTATPLLYQEDGGRVAHTSEFVDLNLYNYDAGVNDLWENNKYYPGFQWPGGAYAYYTTYDSYYGTTYADTSSFAGIPGYRTDRHATDSVSFGDNIVADLKYADSQSAFENNTYEDSYGYTYANRYGKAPNATSVGILSTNSASSNTGMINWLWWDGTSASVTNRPAGYSTTGKAIQQKTVYNEWFTPQAPITSQGSLPLGYLFPSLQAEGAWNYGVTKRNSQSIDGLFQVNPVSGLYYYNSHQNHAQFDDAADKFVLYDEIITSNFLLYPFGNFLPFNDINSDTTQVGKLNDTNGAGAVDGSTDSGGMRNYVLQTIEKLKNRMHGMDYEGSNYSSRLQLKTMLEEYWEDWYLEDGASAWYNLTSGEAITDYFLAADDGPGIDPGFTQEQLDNIYNIDWDEPTDFFFGMDMSMNILMPKNALSGHDNGNNNEPWQVREDGTFVRGGKPDGIPDYPMVFNFAGDDDVWVYIDGLLYLDLTGIHRHVGGTIDFETGIVYYFELLPGTGDTANNTTNATYYYAETFEEIITRSFTDSEADQMNAMLDGLRPVLNADGTQRYFTNAVTGEVTAMKTFKDYTTHTFKFFYMERGSGSSVCRMNFNFPMLKQNSISVQKELTSDVDVEMLGNPDFRFQILKADENDNKLNELFIGGGVQYTIYDSITNAAIGTGTTDANGIFALKAGQRAEFEGIDENAGKYYVRELINKEYFEQYGEISVDGIVIHDTVLGLENDTFKGVDSPVKDVSNGTTVFIFDNQVTVDKLGSLSVSKILENDADASDKEFRMSMTLDGKPLPVGMLYTLSDGTTVAVEEEGIILLKGGQTATISNVIAGTRFTVSETSESAVGYFVSYAQTDADEPVVSSDGVSGMIRMSTTVQVQVTNAENAASVTIPGTKRLSNGSLGAGEHTYSFTISRVGAVDGGGNALGLFADYSETKSVIVTGTNTAEFDFMLRYVASDFADTPFPVTITYEIRESAESVSDAIIDPAVYTAEVTIRRDDTGRISAELTSLTKEGNSAGSADFVNILAADLTLEKIVDGSDNAQETAGFTFHVILKDASGAPLANQSFSATIVGSSGTVTTDGDGRITLTGIGHEDTVVIHGIPLGTQWTITEQDADGYMVSWEANDNPGSSKEAAGSLTNGGIRVVFTNTSTYVLPETGGSGAMSYTMAGLVLICFSMAYLMYRIKNRRRGAFESP